MSLIITVPPTAEPVALQEVKDRLRLTTTDDDATITSHITTAREYAESVSGWSLAAKSYRLVLDDLPYNMHDVVKLLRPPLVSVIGVQYLDWTYTWQTWDPSEYWVAAQNVPAVIEPKFPNTWPRPVRARGCVQIDYTTGAYPYTPIIEGIRELAAHFYEHPETVSPDGLKEVPTGFTTLFKTKRAHCEF